MFRHPGKEFKFTHTHTHTNQVKVTPPKETNKAQAQ